MASDAPVSARAGLRPPRVTAADVAQAAGVSRSAVSRAFNPDAYLDAEKRRLILTTAHRLGYYPNALASSLQGKRTNLVALVAGDHGRHYDAEFVSLLIAELNAAQMWPIVLGRDFGVSDEDVLSVLRYPLDALIIRGGSVDPAVIENCTKLNIPVIVSGQIMEGPKLDCVCCRNTDGFRAAAELLGQRGRKRLAYIGGPAAWNAPSARLRGVVEGSHAAGLDLVAREVSDYSFEGGRQSMARICAAHQIDALICANDAMALGALSYLRHSTNLRVPDDIAVVGFDDIEMSAWPDFALTTFRNPQEEVAHAIVVLLAARMQEPEKPGETIMIDPVLVERNTH